MIPHSFFFASTWIFPTAKFGFAPGWHFPHVFGTFFGFTMESGSSGGRMSCTPWQEGEFAHGRGADLVRPPQRPKATVYATHVSEQCSKCHSSIKIMGKFGIETEQVATYKESGIIYWTATFFKWLTIGTMLALIAHIFLDMYGRTKRLRGER